MKTGYVIGQGAAAMDTIINCSALPEADSFAAIQKEWLTSGGSAANTLVTVAQLGGKAALVAQVGDDELGKQFRKELLEDGVEDDYLFIKKDGITMHTYVLVDPEGRRSILVNRGNSNHYLKGEQLPSDCMDGAAVCYIGGSPGSVAVQMVRYSKKKGIPIFMQIENLPSALISSFCTREQFEESISSAAMISAGRAVFRELGNCDDLEYCIKQVYEKYLPIHGVVCTAGEEGCLWYDGEIMRKASIFKVDAIDTTGAGDSFCGGLIYAYFLKKMDKQQAMLFSNACGAMKCACQGPRLRVTENQVLEFIAAYQR